MFVPRTLSTNFEVSGRLATALVANVHHPELTPLIQKYDLAEIDGNQWYGVQNILTMFGEMARYPHFYHSFIAMGMAAAKLLIQVQPPEIQALSLDEALRLEEQLVFAHFRNPPPNFYVHISQPKKEVYVHDSQTVWPDDLNYGFVYSFVRYYCPKRFTLFKDGVLPGQDEGGEFLRLRITLS